MIPIEDWAEALLLEGTQLRPSQRVDDVELDRRVKALDRIHRSSSTSSGDSARRSWLLSSAAEMEIE